VRRVAPEKFEVIAQYEERFGFTIQRKLSVRQLADIGTPYASITDERIAAAMSDVYTGQIILDTWSLPPGAFGDSAGPL
jgi:hypothetical protein